MEWAVRFYADETGWRPVEDYFRRVPESHLGKIHQVIQMLAERGPNLPFPYSSQVQGRLRELRAHFGRELYRILYYCDVTRTFVLLHAFEKRSEKLSVGEIAIALQRMAQDHKMIRTSK